GLVKLTVVVDDRHRLEVDARHGHLKARVLDDETVAKIMGGKDRSLRPDGSAALLRAIGIMNADGSISARSAKKYKQVNHLVELCRPVWEALLAGRGDRSELRIVDLACGNSYLSFVLLEALRLERVPARLLGVDLREDVIETSRARAAEIGMGEQAHFLATRLESLRRETIEAALGGPADLAISLHACDTATDAALDLALAAEVRAILCVPCCQAELARQLEAASGASGLEALPPALLDQGLLRRHLGEVLTDALRVEVLEAWGYQVSVVEFVDSAHTPKNLLLRALPGRGRSAAARATALAAVERRCEALGVRPRLLQLALARSSD
ncbi:MAG: SAM-dependent methyltransferase, partial [Myxococcales bacterium]|nr:SAM-dependent methyltransferase [Myxococcales bacterium]